MNAQNDAGATDVSEETEPVSEATEQSTQSAPSFQDVLLQTAKAEGHDVGIMEDEPKAETETESDEELPEKETTEETETETESGSETEGVPEGEDVEEGEKPPKDLSLADQIKWYKNRGEKVPWYLPRILEENGKARDRLTRAEEAERKVSQLQAQLAKAIGPKPTEDDPFRDIQTLPELERMKKSYKDAIKVLDRALDIAEVDGEAELVVGDKTQKLTYAQLKEKRREADESIRDSIPERAKYLEQRAIADAQAAEVYPELRDPESEFTQQCAILAHRLLSGEAMKDPNLLIWVGHAVKGYRDSLQKNGKTSAVKTPEAKKILQSSKQKIAPTPVKSRSLPETRTSRSSSEVVKASKKLEQEGSQEAALELLNAMRLGQAKTTTRLEAIPD